MSSWGDELAEMRAAWAKRPRLPPPEWFPTPPTWAAADPVFNGTHAAELWTKGDVDWGWVLMANNAAWEAGTVIAPGAVLFSDDVVLRQNPFRMSEVAERVWAMRKAPPTRVGLRAFKAWALDDNAPNPAQRVPHAFTEGRVVWVGGVLMQRDSLVDRRLQHSLIPIVRAYSHELTTIALAPLLAWSEGLKARWAPDVAT
ncbi:hypothetical protein LBMAG42_14760 [Deltaproteobacteria bacterium]|nr:hypothetical protein LBMAG42_14760 [Deltaproteobacteria bacterium]